MRSAELAASASIPLSPSIQVDNPDIYFNSIYICKKGAKESCNKCLKNKKYQIQRWLEVLNKRNTKFKGFCC